MKNRDKEYIIGYDIGGPEDKDCAVVMEKLPDGTINVVDVLYRDRKAVEGIVEDSYKTGLAKLKRSGFKKELDKYRYTTTLVVDEQDL